MSKNGRRSIGDVVRELKATLRFVLALLSVWLLAWIPIGIWIGDIDYVLTTVSRGSSERQLYQALLYLGLGVVFFLYWRQHKPNRPGWGTAKWFAVYFGQGLLASVVLRLILWKLGFCSWEVTGDSCLFGVQVLLSCLTVALVEEAVFRGFLLGHLVAKFGWSKGASLCSLLFASVHLFRPGSLTFKLMYGIGLFALAYLLSCLAWHHDSIFASAGFHGGVILLNLGLDLEFFQVSVWSGFAREPVSGLLSLVLTLSFVSFWSRWTQFDFLKS